MSIEGSSIYIQWVFNILTIVMAAAFLYIAKYLYRWRKILRSTRGWLSSSGIESGVSKRRVKASKEVLAAKETMIRNLDANIPLLKAFKEKSGLTTEQVIMMATDPDMQPLVMGLIKGGAQLFSSIKDALGGRLGGEGDGIILK